MKARIRVDGYVRESTDKQIQETEGIEIQRERIIEFCKKNDYELVEIFSDEGISGAKDVTERPALMDMMNHCKNSSIQYVIIDKPDRLARKFENQLFVEMDLKRSKIDVLYATNETTNIDEEDTEMDKIMKIAMRQMMGVFAELDRKMIVKRLSDGMTKKAKNGNKPVGRPNFGYKFSNDKKSYLIDEAQASIVKEIFEMRSNGMVIHDIIKNLNKNKYLKRYQDACAMKNDNYKWAYNTVRLILKNPVYIGKVKHADIIYDGNHTPIIDMDLWNIVQEINEAGKKNYINYVSKTLDKKNNVC